MSILVCTPVYQGNLQFPYFQSMLALQDALGESGLEFDILVTTNESLIQRARNTMASRFLETKFDKLLFIDSDIEFAAEDVAKLWNMNAHVCAGPYRMKAEDGGYAAWRDGKRVWSLDGLEDIESVEYAGTGFMMIDRAALERMKDIAPRHVEGHECWAFFNPRVEGDVYLSEDYAFCHDWRSLGGEILLNTTVRLTHWGFHGYRS